MPKSIVLRKVLVYGSFRGLAASLVLAGLLFVLLVESLAAHNATPAATSGAPADSLQVADSVQPMAVEPESSGGIPIFFTVGAGYGQRRDPCAYCASPQNTESFTGHFSIGKSFAYGLGLGVDASVWQKGHPGPEIAGDSTTAAVPTSLSNRLGNASLTLSWQVWRLFVRGGGGFAWGHQDIAGLDEEGEATIERASGKGIGYSFGGGITLPLASAISLVIFGNYNVGTYDLSSPSGVVERGVTHEYLELGFGLTIR